MRIFADIDGVLLDFDRSFVRYLNRAHQKNLPEDYQSPSFFYKEVLTLEQMKETYMGFLASEEVGEMAALVDPEKFNALAAKYPVHLLTNFPKPYGASREKNLNQLGFEFESLHYCQFPMKEAKEKMLSKGEWVQNLKKEGERVLFVDDLPENCLEVLESNPETDVWVMTRRFNADFSHPEIRRAEDWRDLFAHLGEPGEQGPDF